MRSFLSYRTMSARSELKNLIVKIKEKFELYSQILIDVFNSN